MKKKIILILSMCALLVCLFVISASATDAIYMVDFDSSSEGISNEISDTCFEDTNFSIKVSSNGNIWVIHNIEGFQSFVNNMDYDSFYELCQSRYNSCGHNLYSKFIESSYRFEQCFDYFVNYGKNEITEEDLTAQYNQGKTDGVTEYKESEEYSNVLSTQYNQGKTDGVAEFKDSEAYETVLAVERSIGASEGVANYLDSTEYADTLQAEYDKGYDDAESEKASNMLGTALGSVGIVVFVLLGVWLWITLSKKKKRRR